MSNVRARGRLRLAAAAFLLQSVLHAGPPVNPSGGSFVAGRGSIAQSASGLVINQSTLRGVIDWNSFSIGQGAAVLFKNGSGATLNLVSGGGMSSILGSLIASGSVYILNPEGILIGRGARINTGGDFVASTLNVSPNSFMSGGSLLFSGSSAAMVVNLGSISSTGGGVFLIGQTVENQGSISAPNGTAGLGAGSTILLRDSSSDQRVYVQAGTGDLTNAGTIAAAQAELKTADGNIYALAGNNGGQITATGTASRDGHIWLVSTGGNVDVAGSLSARNQNGTGGSIETSGASVNTAGASISTGNGGSWLLDPDDLTIDSTLAATIDTTLNGGTNVTEQTTASGTGGNGDITVASNIAWTTGASLTLSAYRNITVDTGITVSNSGSGNLTLRADNASTGAGAVTFNGTGKVDFSASTGNVSILYDPTGATKYTSPVNYSSNVTTNSSWTAPSDQTVSSQLTAYMLINNVTDLSNVSTNLSGTYALGTNIDEAASRILHR